MKFYLQKKSLNDDSMCYTDNIFFVFTNYLEQCCSMSIYKKMFSKNRCPGNHKPQVKETKRDGKMEVCNCHLAMTNLHGITKQLCKENYELQCVDINKGGAPPHVLYAQCITNNVSWPTPLVSIIYSKLCNNSIRYIYSRIITYSKEFIILYLLTLPI